MNKKKKTEWIKQWKKDNREQIKEYEKEYYHKNRDKIKSYQKKYINSDKGQKAKLKDRIDNKHKYSSRSHTNFHLTKAKECLFCNTKNPLEFHHLRYRTPSLQEDVITLCISCHHKLEKILKTSIEETEKELFDILDEFHMAVLAKSESDKLLFAIKKRLRGEKQ